MIYIPTHWAMIYIVNKKRGIQKIRKDFPNADILDITSSSEYWYAQLLSPFYPHMNIPIPNTPNLKATCVEAVWQGLKVFRNADVDFQTFKNDTMHDLKRTVRKYGPPIGHRYGAYSDKILNYFDARMLIYLPTYKYVLDNIPEVHKIVDKIKERAKDHIVILLDYNTNTDFRDVTKPLSHAELVKMYIEGCYPEYSEDIKPLTDQELKEKKAKDKKVKKEVKTAAKTGIDPHNEPTLF